MEFSVGDKVVHPRCGFGCVTGLERLDLVDGFERYYMIEIPDQGLTVHVPVRKAVELGVRPVMSQASLSRVLETLRGRPRSLSEDYKVRQDRIRERLEAGRPLSIAEVVRDLTWHERRTRLTKADSELLARGRDFLAAEIALVTDTDVVDVKQAIDIALTGSEANDPDQQEPGSEARIPVESSSAQTKRQTLLGIR